MPLSRAPKRGLRRRPDPSRQGHEDRRYRRYYQPTSRRICAKRFAGRMPACGRGYRQYLYRRTDRPPHRLQSLRLGRTRPKARAGVRHRANRPQSAAPKPNSGSTEAAPLSSPVESGTALRLDAPLPPPRHPMGVPHRKLPWLCSTRLPSHLAQAFMKLLPGPLRRMRSQSTYSEIIPIVPSHVSTN